MGKNFLMPADLDQLAASVGDALTRHSFPWFDPGAGETVLAPEASGPGYWVGAPSVAVDDQGQRVLISYRRRRPRDGSADERGHLAAIAASTDGGRTFSDIWSLSKHEVGTSSLERFCLRQDGPARWLLYTSWESPPSSGRWRIDVMEAGTPADFTLVSAAPVLLPDQAGADAVKDPYVLSYHDQDLMYTSTFLTPRGPAPTGLATGTGGTGFSWAGTVLEVGSPGSWDAYQARISSVLAMASGYLCYYDGAASAADDTEEHCGIAVSTDLHRWRRVTTAGPALVSPHATGSLRYVEAVRIGGSLWAYYEYARPDGSHELRRNHLGAEASAAGAGRARPGPEAVAQPFGQ